MGKPKALVGDERGSWLRRSVRLLLDGGCEAVTVVLGAAADEARPLLSGLDAEIVVAEDWSSGLSASLNAGLAHLAATEAQAALVMLVDLPDLTVEVLRRVVDAGGTPESLARATFHGRLGHPVLIGRAHWPGIVASTVGDRGARDYLVAHEALLVECGDLATGRDVDTL